MLSYLILLRLSSRSWTEYQYIYWARTYKIRMYNYLKLLFIKRSMYSAFEIILKFHLLHDSFAFSHNIIAVH